MSLAMRSRVISMWKNGYRLSKIWTRLLEEGIAVSKKSLCLNIIYASISYQVRLLIVISTNHPRNGTMLATGLPTMQWLRTMSCPHPSCTLRSIRTYMYVRVKALCKCVGVRIRNASMLVHVGLRVINTTFTCITHRKLNGIR